MINRNLLRIYEYGDCNPKKGEDRVEDLQKILDKIKRENKEKEILPLKDKKVKLRYESINRNRHHLSETMKNFIDNYRNEIFIARKGIDTSRDNVYSLECTNKLLTMTDIEKMFIFDNHELISLDVLREYKEEEDVKK